MYKALIIARREYLAMVGAKAFLISVAMMPVFMLGGAVVPQMLGNRLDVKTRHVAVVDESGALAEAIQEAVDLYNREATRDPQSNKQIAPEYVLEHVSAPEMTDELRLDLSDRVRQGQLHGFLEIPADVLSPPSPERLTAATFYAENTALSETKRWFEQTLSTLVQSRRLRSAGIDPDVVAQSQAFSVHGRGLLQRDADGGIKKTQTANEIVTILLPLGIMMFMFMIVMMSAQPMLESVLEEKTNRIAEVLLGSATPSQIMAGKLFGNVAGSLTVAAIYLAGAYALAVYNDVVDLVPTAILPWMVLFQVLAVVMFSSMFMAIGAAVNQLKEAQSLLLPIWIMIVLPLFVWINIVREPNSAFATWFSLIPPFIPMLMCLRLAVTSTIPLWQPIVGLILMIGTTSLCVVAAGRVFRVGMLAQGQSPKFTELVRWAMSG
jgi:ABC-2 type transport system permease protein